MKKQHIVFDTEIIGKNKPVFLVCTKIVETGERFSFWHHKKGDLQRFLTLFDNPKYIFIGFNSWRFDMPLIAGWINGLSAATLKLVATRIIEENMMPWEAYKLVGMPSGLDVDHIDLIETAPGVMVSLKTYMGRMHYPTLIDLPFHHDQDLTPRQCKELEVYCLNDDGGTVALFKRLKEELQLRIDLGKLYDLDLRSKSDAQAAEAILKKEAKLGKSTGYRPRFVTYTTPKIIKTRSKLINQLIVQCESEDFKIDPNNGSPIEAPWMASPKQLRNGLYKFGLGGLHSKHDKKVCYVDDNEWGLSEIDAASYYPTMILNCGLVPDMQGRGQEFMRVYGDIYQRRMHAKRTGDKKVAYSLKIAMNGVFGKLGNLYCSFYAPELLLAVTLTGQLNLMCLIDELSAAGVFVVSANTDGIVVRYRKNERQRMLDVIAKNSKRTGFDYEETPYKTIAFKDVNNYIGVKPDGTVKAKGLYADEGLQKNPTMQVCSDAAAEYLKNGTKPERYIAKQRKIEPFLAIRNVKGGGVQHTKFGLVDDWENVEHKLWISPSTGKKEKRVSRPAPFEVGTGGKPFGRVARWYMTTESMPPITYVSNGNKVPKTEGARLCLTLPEKSAIPADLDRQRYVNEAYEILRDIGVAV